MENVIRVKKIETRPDGSRRVYTINTEPSMTDQSMSDATDVNNIIAKFNKTGEITHMRQNQGVYADVSQFQDLHTALSQVREAEYAFLTLPGQLRARFNNDPIKFVEFLQDPKNDTEAVVLGLKTLSKNPLYTGPSTEGDGQASVQRASPQTKKQKAQNDDD